jgi:myo-inositol 2-dehydrogenase / D-chiro-inositol 1-dehydrogenase
MNTGTDSSHPVSRRDFLKAASATVASGAFFAALPGVARAASGEVVGSPTLKLAVIGCGGRGTGAAHQALATGPDVKLVAMADAFGERVAGSLRSLTERYPDQVDVPPERQFVGFDGYMQAIAEADVVILATPPGFRPMQFEAAVQAGKHVFMEKPVAVDAPGVRRVLAAAEEAKLRNLKVAVGFQRRHQPGYIETVRRLQDGAIGDLVSMRCYWASGGVWVRPRRPEWTEMEYQMRNWYYFNWLCGDHIVEQHVHNIDVLNWAKGAYPVRAQGQGGRQLRHGPDHGEIFDHHFVEFEYADGSRLFSQCRHQPGWSSVSEHAQGTMGRADIGRYLIQGAETWRYRTEEPDAYQEQQRALFRAIRENEPMNEADFGAMSTMTAILGRMCTYSNRMLTFEEAMNSQVNLLPERLAWDANPPTMPDEHGRYPIPQPGSNAPV